MQDKDIIELYFARSEEAITETDKKYGNYCRALTRNILGSTEDSEECVNDTYMRLWESIPPKRPPAFGAFVAKVARDLAINMRERMSAAKRGGGFGCVGLDEIAGCLPSPESVERTVDDAEFTRAVERFLMSLNKEKQTIFMQRYFCFAEVKDIAHTLGISESKVKVTLMRTREKLRRYLEKEGIDI